MRRKQGMYCQMNTTCLTIREEEKEIFEETMTQEFLKLMKVMNLQFKKLSEPQDKFKEN